MIGERIRSAREQLGLTLKEVADGVGVSFQSVQQWEDGTSSPKKTRLNNLAKVLETTPEWLIFGAGHASKKDVVETSDFINSPEFIILMRGAYLEAIKLSMAMGWVEVNKKKNFNTLADVFEGKLRESLLLDQGAEKTGDSIVSTSKVE